MLPRDLPKWLIPSLWIGSLLPPLAIKFWPWEPLFSYHANEKVGELVSEMFLAFFTAFPFWWIIEIYQRKFKQRDLAKKQLALLEDLRHGFKHLIMRMLIDTPSIYSMPDEDVRQQIKAAIIREDEERKDCHWDTVKYVIFLLEQMGPRGEHAGKRFDPHRSEFSLEFNTQVDSVIRAMQAIGIMVRDKSEPNMVRLDLMLIGFFEARNELRRLENIYFAEHGIKQFIKPADERLYSP